MSVGIAGPPLNTAFVYYATFCEGAWEGTRTGKRVDVKALIDEGTEKVKKDLLRLTTASLGWWLPANTTNFLFVPAQFRPLVLSLQSAFWMGYLSWVQHL